MSRIWTMVNSWNLKKEVKTNCFLSILCLISALAGLFLWLVFGRILWGEVKYLLCFVGYPMMFAGFLGGILYLYNHELT